MGNIPHPLPRPLSTARGGGETLLGRVPPQPPIEALEGVTPQSPDAPLLRQRRGMRVRVAPKLQIIVLLRHRPAHFAVLLMV